MKKKKRREEIENRIKIQNENLNKIKEIANKIIFPNDIINNIKIEEFEKDNDTNGHIEFLYAASNLRANNFRIENCDIYKVKMISGKITPSIATTTASIVGLVSLQLYPLMQSENINYLRECSFNLAFNNYMNTTPTPCEFIKNIENNENIKYIPDEFTIWDFIEINESMTIEQLIKFIKDKYNINISLISSRNLNLYESNLENENIHLKIEDVFNKISKIKLSDEKRFLILDILGKCENLVAKMPRIKYIFK